ncbi:MAG: YigZ family protein [Bacillaceae bacterium G1]|nr:YigZ family protein [Bacillota bacterium]OJF16512.1 MAG: YigZ family protein [Bacillaceae bacterium G1]
MSLYTIAQAAEVTLEIKKSKFIGRVRPVASEDEAKAWIAEIQKQHHDATHNCYAYLIGQHQEIQKSNDDGEPAGTAGRPMLETLKKNQLYNVAAVVTRYFGGILLGASGLIRAYSQATAAAVRAAGIVQEVLHTPFTLEMDYGWWGRVEHWLRQTGTPADPPSFTDRVSLTVYLQEDAIPAFLKQMAEMTNGAVVPKPGTPVWRRIPVTPPDDDHSTK